VDVQDNIAPTASCQDVSVQLDENGTASITVNDADNGSSDACGFANLSLGQSNFDCADIGDNIVTLRVTDVGGNTSSCDLTVTVQESGPTALCVGLASDQGVSLNSPLYHGGPLFGQSFTAGLSGPLYKVRVNMESIAENNASLAPTIEIQQGEGLNGTIISSVEAIPAPASTSTPPQWWEITFSAPAEITAGSTYTIVLKANSTNAASAFLRANVVYNNPYPDGRALNINFLPGSSDLAFETFVSLGDPVKVELNAAGLGTLSVDQVDAGSFDDCGIASASLSQSSFSCADIGEQVVTLTLVDASGSTTSCETTVTVEGGGSAPTCKDQTVQLGTDGSIDITAEDLLDESSNLCGSIHLTIDVNTFTCEDLGSNTVSLTATDEDGNEATCTAEVIVQDNETPLISCPADILVDNDAGICGAIVNFSVTLSDNCTTSLTQDLGLSSGATFPEGITEQQFTTADAAGNTATCSFSVEVAKSGDPNLLSAYTVIGFEEVKMKENIVLNGGVGIKKSGEKVKLEGGTMITGDNTFVKAPELDLSGGSQVTHYFSGRVDGDILPNFLAASPCENDVKFEDNSGSFVLDQDCYGKIEVGKNVHVSFSGHETVRVEEMDLKEGSSISFDQDTDILLKKQFKGGKEMVLSNNDHEVWIYAKGDVKFEINSLISTNLYTKKKLQVEKGSDLTGLYIADKVDSKEEVTWNWSQNCLSDSPTASSFITLNDRPSDSILETQKWTEEPTLSAFPNPFQSKLNISFFLPEAGRASLAVFDLQGRLVRQLEDGMLDYGEHTKQWDGAHLSGSKLPSGIYFIQLRLEDRVMNQKVLLQRL
ncbi:MAG: HYR domain-containing protein, partial [Saprospiraceae bacterium]|nr:HYR domain-containing protein [Saprospiraceae bacterium]